MRKNLLLKVIENRPFQHLLFWLVSFVFITLYFSISNRIAAIDLIYATFFHIPVIILVYLHLYIVISFFQKQQYVFFLSSLLINLAFAYILHELIFDILVPILSLGFFIVSFTEMELLLSLFIIYLLFTSLLKFSRSWFQVQQIQKEKTVLELENLKAQINPHFLVNSLNTIYGLSLNQRAEAPQAILKLSDLLKQMLYESNNHFIPLSKEIDQINNYLDLQRLRINRNIEIDFKTAGETKNIYIAPLLLITLIENSFKHGCYGRDEDFFHFILNLNGKKIVFTTVNSYCNPGEIKKSNSGIGLVNLKRRLDLLYGKQYKLDIKEEKNKFTVQLVLTN